MVYYTQQYLQSFTDEEKAIEKIKEYIAINNQAYANSGLENAVSLQLHCTPQLLDVSDSKYDKGTNRLRAFTTAKKGKDGVAHVKYLLQSADIAILMTKNGVSLHDSFCDSC